jgi:hypothetical protein
MSRIQRFKDSKHFNNVSAELYSKANTVDNNGLVNVFFDEYFYEFFKETANSIVKSICTIDKRPKSPKKVQVSEKLISEQESAIKNMQSTILGQQAEIEQLKGELEAIQSSNEMQLLKSTIANLKRTIEEQKNELQELKGEEEDLLLYLDERSSLIKNLKGRLRHYGEQLSDSDEE